MPVKQDARLDAADLNVRGIPLGELVSFPPRHVALLALTGDLPSASAVQAFNARLLEGAGPMRDLAAALDELDACEQTIATQAAEGLSSFVAELIRCFFAMTVATSTVDSGPGGLDAASEMIGAAAWIAEPPPWLREPPPWPSPHSGGGEFALGKSQFTKPVTRADIPRERRPSRRIAGEDGGSLVGDGGTISVRVPGFGHPRLHGLDPRFVAIHAIVVRSCAYDAPVVVMQSALRWVPQMLARAGSEREHEHEHEHEHESRRQVVLANMYLPMGVGLMAGGVAPRAHAERLVRAPASVQAAIDAVLRDR